MPSAPRTRGTREGGGGGESGPPDGAMMAPLGARATEEERR